jgi:hypothetical protein
MRISADQKNGLGRSGTSYGEARRKVTHWPQMNADQHRSAQAGLPVPHNSDDGISQEMHESDQGNCIAVGGIDDCASGRAGGEACNDRCGLRDDCEQVDGMMGEEAGFKWQKLMRGKIHVCGENCQNGHDCQRLKIENLTPKSVWNENGSVALARVNGHDTATLARVNGSVTSGGVIDDERPVMGPRFIRAR